MSVQPVDLNRVGDLRVTDLRPGAVSAALGLSCSAVRHRHRLRVAGRVHQSLSPEITTLSRLRKRIPGRCSVVGHLELLVCRGIPCAAFVHFRLVRANVWPDPKNDPTCHVPPLRAVASFVLSSLRWSSLCYRAVSGLRLLHIVHAVHWHALHPAIHTFAATPHELRPTTGHSSRQTPLGP